jgi:hypothetical protein
MKTLKRSKVLGAMLGGLTALGMIGTAQASSHREAPAISNDPAADNTDVYAWTEGGNLNVIANWIPFEEPSGGPNFFKFSDDVLYEVHITKPGIAGPDGGANATYTFDDQAYYQFRFKTAPIARVEPGPDAGLGGGVEFFAQLTGTYNQSYTVTKIDGNGVATDLTPAGGLKVAPPNIGPVTDQLANGLPSGRRYDDAFAATFNGTLSDGTQIFAGPRDDPFYVDLGGIFDLANLRAKGTAQDGLYHFNVHSVVMQIPLANLQGGGIHQGTAGDDSTVGIWAASSRRKVRILRNDGTENGFGAWTQVSRLAIPLVNEALIGFQDKDKYNRTTPRTDVANFAGYFLAPTLVRDAAARGVYASKGVTDISPYDRNRLDLIGAINLAPDHR